MNETLRRRVAPSFPLRLELSEDGDRRFYLNLRLAFDFNAIALIEERTGLFVIGGGEKSVWNHLHSARVVSVMLWAACLARNPEYDSDEGLAVIRSCMDPGNIGQVAGALDEAFLLSLPADRQAEIRASRKNKSPKEGEPDPTPEASII